MTVEQETNHAFARSLSNAGLGCTLDLFSQIPIQDEEEYLPTDETIYCLWWENQRTWKPKRLEEIKQARIEKQKLSMPNVKVRGCALLRRNLPPIKLTPD